APAAAAAIVAAAGRAASGPGRQFLRPARRVRGNTDLPAEARPRVAQAQRRLGTLSGGSRPGEHERVAQLETASARTLGMSTFARSCWWSFLLTPAAVSALAQTSRVTLEKTPDGGIQPQAVSDAHGDIHLVYFKGAPSGGDVYYAATVPATTGFSQPIRVN